MASAVATPNRAARSGSNSSSYDSHDSHSSLPLPSMDRSFSVNQTAPLVDDAVPTSPTIAPKSSKLRHLLTKSRWLGNGTSSRRGSTAAPHDDNDFDFGCVGLNTHCASPGVTDEDFAQQLEQGCSYPAIQPLRITTDQQKRGSDSSISSASSSAATGITTPGLSATFSTYSLSTACHTPSSATDDASFPLKHYRSEDLLTKSTRGQSTPAHLLKHGRDISSDTLHAVSQRLQQEEAAAIDALDVFLCMTSPNAPADDDDVCAIASAQAERTMRVAEEAAHRRRRLTLMASSPPGDKDLPPVPPIPSLPMLPMRKASVPALGATRSEPFIGLPTYSRQPSRGRAQTVGVNQVIPSARAQPSLPSTLNRNLITKRSFSDMSTERRRSAALQSQASKCKSRPPRLPIVKGGVRPLLSPAASPASASFPQCVKMAHCPPPTYGYI